MSARVPLPGSRLAMVGLLSLALLALALIDGTGANLRLDLTERRIHTLSPGTRALLRGLEAPVTLRLYDTTARAPTRSLLADHARDVADLLARMAQASEGRLVVEHLRPAPLSEAEAAARDAGIQPIPTGLGTGAGGEELLLGIVAEGPPGSTRETGQIRRRGMGERSVLARLLPQEDATLEFDIARLVDQSVRSTRPRIALLSGLDGFARAGTSTGRGPVAELLRRMALRFEILILDPDVSGIPEDIDALMLVHPRALSDATRYGIEHHLLAGGPALLFLDPWAERDGQAALPLVLGAGARRSRLDDLLAGMGVRLREEIVLDPDYAMPVTLSPGAAPLRHPAMPALTQRAFRSGDVLMARLEQINLSTPGALEGLPEGATEFLPLLSASPRATLLDPQQSARLADPGALYAEIVASEISATEPDARSADIVLAARVRGEARSSFADDPTFAPERTRGVVDLIIVADTDLLTDALWTVRDGAGTARAWASNGDFVINALDQLAGDDGLLEIRGQARTRRPFSRIEAMQREADARLLGDLTALERALAEAERRIDAARGRYRSADADADAAALNRASLDEVLAERARLRGRIRAVRSALVEDIEDVHARLRALNVFGLPATIALIGCAFGLWRRRRTHMAETLHD